MNLDEAAFNNQFGSHRLQQLDKNVFFGSLPSLNNIDSLRENNIRFFIGVDIPTETMAKLYTQSNLTNLYSSPTDIIMINFDSSIVPKAINFNDHAISLYHQNNTMLLRSLVQHIDPQVFTTKHTIYGDKKHYLSTETNIFQLNNFDVFERFNDWLELFKLTQQGTLIFGDHESNETLMALLVSAVIKKSANLKIMDALQFIKSLKNDSNDGIKEHNIYWNSGLLSYYETIRKYSLKWGVNSKKAVNYHSSFFNNTSVSPNKRRGNVVVPSAAAVPLTPKSPSKDVAGSTFAAIDRSKRARSD